METAAITHEVFFHASPKEVFEALTDSAKHSKFTGAPAEIRPEVGSKFSLYGGSLTGTILELTQDALIVQSWRADDLPDGHFSTVSYTLAPLHDGRGTHLSLIQTGVPSEHFDEINQGWRDYYWTRMATYFREEKVAVVRRFMEEFKNKANLDIVDELFTSDFVLHLPGVTLPPGPAGQKTIGSGIFAAFSGVNVTVNETIVEGNMVVERHTAHAVHSGEFNGIAATGKNVYWTENHIYRLQDGKIAEAWSEVSFHDLMKQISTP
jgi:uncharacterized protein YndB with AHSA1/START domain/ketosteroid isomerase-like protein